LWRVLALHGRAANAAPDRFEICNALNRVKRAASRTRLHDLAEGNTEQPREPKHAVERHGTFPGLEPSQLPYGQPDVLRHLVEFPAMELAEPAKTLPDSAQVVRGGGVPEPVVLGEPRGAGLHR
jgi:hypothetical protein